MSKRNAPVVRAVFETMESRRLMSAVIELGDKLVLVAGGHGVSTKSSDVASYFNRRKAISKTIEIVATSSADLPPGAVPYSDPQNEQVIGIDKDGLILVQPQEQPDGQGGSTLPTPPTIPPVKVASRVAAESIAAEVVAPNVAEQVRIWKQAHPDTVDADGLRVVTPLPETLASKVDYLPTPTLLGRNGFGSG